MHNTMIIGSTSQITSHIDSASIYGTAVLTQNLIQTVLINSIQNSIQMQMPHRMALVYCFIFLVICNNTSMGDSVYRASLT